MKGENYEGGRKRVDRAPVQITIEPHPFMVWYWMEPGVRGYTSIPRPSRALTKVSRPNSSMLYKTRPSTKIAGAQNAEVPA